MYCCERSSITYYATLSLYLCDYFFFYIYSYTYLLELRRKSLILLLLKTDNIFQSHLIWEMESLSELVEFPLLQTPIDSHYRACTIPYRFPSDNPRKPTPTEISWIDLFLNSIPSFKYASFSSFSFQKNCFFSVCVSQFRIIYSIPFCSF